MNDITLTDVDFPRFEHEVERMARAIAHACAAHDAPDVGIKIKISGRIHSDLRITFAVGGQYDMVTANSLLAALNEHFRRRGWEQEHAPVLLSYIPGEAKEPSDFAENILKEDIL